MKRFDRIAVLLFTIILVVSTLSNVVTSRQATKAAKGTDLISSLIVACSTEGTKCFELQKQNEARRTAGNKCIIEALIDLPPIAERENRRAEILSGYDNCIEIFTREGVNTTTTTAPTTSTSK
jgi:hypothetical protein